MALLGFEDALLVGFDEFATLLVCVDELAALLFIFEDVALLVCVGVELFCPEASTKNSEDAESDETFLDEPEPVATGSQPHRQTPKQSRPAVSLKNDRRVFLFIFILLLFSLFKIKSGVLNRLVNTQIGALVGRARIAEAVISVVVVAGAVAVKAEG